MRKIAISLSKGGVGKSTTAVNLSAGLAEKGFKVLLIDTDTQGQCSPFLGVKPEKGLAEVIEGTVQASEAIVEARKNLFLLAGGRKLAEIKNLIAKKDFRPEETLTEALGDFKSFDFVLLDSSPGWDALTVNVLCYAQEVLCPVSLEVLTLMGFADFIKSIEPIQKYKGVEIRYILPTFYDKRVKKSEEILGQLQGHYQDRLCQPVRYNVRLSEAPGFGQTIFEYAPSSSGAADYRTLTTRVLNGRA